MNSSGCPYTPPPGPTCTSFGFPDESRVYNTYKKPKLRASRNKEAAMAASLRPEAQWLRKHQSCENGNYYSILGLYRDNGKENGNYYSILGLYRDY